MKQFIVDLIIVLLIIVTALTIGGALLITLSTGVF
jgi:hypothetical protein